VKGELKDEQVSDGPIDGPGKAAADAFAAESARGVRNPAADAFAADAARAARNPAADAFAAEAAAAATPPPGPGAGSAAADAFAADAAAASARATRNAAADAFAKDAAVAAQPQSWISYLMSMPYEAMRGVTSHPIKYARNHPFQAAGMAAAGAAVPYILGHGLAPQAPNFPIQPEPPPAVPPLAQEQQSMPMAPPMMLSPMPQDAPPDEGGPMSREEAIQALEAIRRARQGGTRTQTLQMFH
jgi:hypothetical protein